MKYWNEFKKLETMHEGLSLKLYKCTAGYWTIGVGRNLQSNGISADEADYMLENDLRRAWKDAVSLFPAIESYSQNRQLALADMAYNLGKTKLSKFVRMRAAIDSGDWSRAAACARQSLWYRQVKTRGVRVTQMMEEG